METEKPITPWWIPAPPPELSGIEKAAVLTMPNTWFEPEHLPFSVRSPKAVCQNLAGKGILEHRSTIYDKTRQEYRLTPGHAHKHR